MLQSFLRESERIRKGPPGPQLAVLAVFCLALAFVPLFVNDYWTRLIVFVFLNISLATAWNIIGGITGLPSFGHGVFFGLGAYTCAIMMVRFDMPFVIGIAAGGLIAVLFSLLFIPILKQRGFYFALSTLASMLAVETLIDYLPFTRGVEEWDQGWTLPEVMELEGFYMLFLFLMFLGIATVIVLLPSKYGMAFRAIHKDETLSRAMGIPTMRYKVYAFAISAFWPGVLGAVFAPFMTFISTANMFDLGITLNMILVTIFGGIGTVLGPIVGGAMLSVIDQLAWSNFLELHRLVYGLMIVIIITYWPGGLVSSLWSLQRWALMRLERKGARADGREAHSSKAGGDAR
ncbi:MAG: branched-chain amino acid ABC transporter permease [Roseovarius sp.]